MEQLGSKLAADLHGQLFEAGEGGAPRRTFGAVEVADQVFGGSGQDRTPFRRYFYLRNLFSHLQLLASVACLMESGLPWFNLRTAEMPCKPCRTPHPVTPRGIQFASVAPSCSIHSEQKAPSGGNLW